MDIKQLQAEIDAQRHLNSQRAAGDTSGLESYCEYCKYKNKKYFTCTLNHAQKVDKCACAKAYNKYLTVKNGLINSEAGLAQRIEAWLINLTNNEKYDKNLYRLLVDCLGLIEKHKVELEELMITE